MRISNRDCTNTSAGSCGRRNQLSWRPAECPITFILLVSLSRELSIAETVRLVKANSSKWIHGTFPDRQHFAWQAGYGAVSVSFSNVPDVKIYIARQADHHRIRTFQDEFREFLRRHEIEWDERYVWD